MTNDDDDMSVVDEVDEDTQSKIVIGNYDSNNKDQNVKLIQQKQDFSDKLEEYKSKHFKQQQFIQTHNVDEQQICDQTGQEDMDVAIVEEVAEDDEEELEEDEEDDDEDEDDVDDVDDDDDEEEEEMATNQPHKDRIQIEAARQNQDISIFNMAAQQQKSSSTGSSSPSKIKPSESPNRPCTSLNDDPKIRNHQQQVQQLDHQLKQQENIHHHNQQQQQMSHRNHIQLLMNALEKLDPDENGLATVPKEITSSTLTTRIKGVCKINRLIEYSNDLCHSFAEIGSQVKYQEVTNKFREWILKNNIIEHIFGPNCHVEIIKQSHTILNFVAYSLNDQHVNVIWAATLLKHCGRQVLDLLTSLIRFMRTGPVLHLYWLVKNLNIEDYSEHTLLLTSHILRFIWSHSPCINQLQFCHLQKAGNNSDCVVDDDEDRVVEEINQFQQQDFQPPPRQQEPASQILQDGWCTQLGVRKNYEFMDNTSDVSACCSEKDMNDFADFDDDDDDEDDEDDNDNSQAFLQEDDNTLGVHVNTSTHASELFPPPTHQYINQQTQLGPQLPQEQVQEHDTTRIESYDESPNQIDNSNVDSTYDNNDNNMDPIIEESNDEDSRESSSSQHAKFLLEQQRQSIEHYQRQQHQQQQVYIDSINQFVELKKASFRISCMTKTSTDVDFKGLAEYNLATLSEPGKTLLWDLLQDGRIEHLAANLYIEIENVLVNLVMSFGDRFIRYKFIEACLENLSEGTSVILSLRLLPRLLSFNTLTRNLPAPAINETHAIVLWAEREYNMSQNFFRSLVDYYHKRQQQQQKLLIASSEQLSAPDLTDIEQQEILLRQQQELLGLEYDGEQCKSPMLSHIDKIITRMSFLTFIYSRPFSPDTMKLSRDQLDQLWDCLSSDTNLKCSDVLFQWIYQQSMSDDFHGLNGELFDYILESKLPSLEPENFRLRGLKLLEQLIWNHQEYECCHGLENSATRLLWDIGLKAIDDEVSMAAIRILNHFYIYSNHNNSLDCEKGISFMSNCMNQLHSTLTELTTLTDSDHIKESEDYDRVVNHLFDMMQKVILLIRTHLEVFRAHWSFYLRILQLNDEADLVSHRLNAYEIKLTMTIRVVCEAASTMDKTTIEVQAGDFVGELRAEIVKWWYSEVDQTFFKKHVSNKNLGNTTPNLQSPPSSSTPGSEGDNIDLETHTSSQPSRQRPKSYGDRSAALHPFTEFLLANKNSLRLLSHNQEIPCDWDERQINELDIKDMQVIYVLSDMKPSNTADLDTENLEDSNKSHESIRTIYTPKTEIPSIVLLRYDYFERLIEADRFLGLFDSENCDLTTRAKTLSRRVWEIIQILPTCPHYKADLRRCGLPGDDWRLRTAQCSHLLSAKCPQRLLYSLQIIDILKSSDSPNWGSTFIRKGGLADIFEVFMSQKLLPLDDEDWNEWFQECLAYLLKLLFQFGTRPIFHHHMINSNDSYSSNSSSSSKISGCGSNRNITVTNTTGIAIKRIRRNRGRVLNVVSADDPMPIPLFSDELLNLLSNTDEIFKRLFRILNCSAFCKTQADQYYYVTMSSRAMIVHHVMSFLSSWCKSDRKFPYINVKQNERLIKSLILEDPDSSTRREACNGFFKLHLACMASEAMRSRSNSSSNTSVDMMNTSGNSSSNPGESKQTSIDSTTANTTGCGSEQTTPVTNESFSTDLLDCLIKFIHIAEAMKPPKPIRNYLSESDYLKDLNSPGCKDYFWLTCRLIGSSALINLNNTNSNKVPTPAPNLSEQRHIKIIGHRPPFISSINSGGSRSNSATMTQLLVNNSDSKSQADLSGQKQGTFLMLNKPPQQFCAIDLFKLCHDLVVAIRKRQTYETRDFSVEDDTLRGMLLMMVMALKRESSFRYTSTAFEFVQELYGYLFAAPTQVKRYLPKCKAPATRSTAFDLMLTLVEKCPRNYFGLLELLLVDQHDSIINNVYPPDYWPHDDNRSEVGFVGLVNLGATCYLATCMQHLFMIPNLRYSILSIRSTKNIRHGEIIQELQRIFAFMLESERKAYNPKNFCKVYTMDNHPLNIAEQTDMTEFLTDLMTKLEESSPELGQIIKELFSGTLSNNVVSLDCPHISRTTEEFYTLRVQVADMRNLNDSLDELTVKDTLEGDNMYTCSTCEKKVRAEKRACIVKLPRILCFNTMRYTFNMTTMTKEKVNTHFSFPLRLDMADYLEANLMKREQSSSSTSSYSLKDESSADCNTSSLSSTPSDNDKVDIPNSTQEDILMNPQREVDDYKSMNATECQKEPKESTCCSLDPKENQPNRPPSSSSSMTDDTNENLKKDLETVYELIGVTVHTGTAEGGHYYCFIRDCEDQTSDKPRWYLFNDAEVKPFDDSHIGAECFGGELTTKSYDAINDRFMDFSIEKTNSAYMLFYKRIDYKYHSRSVAQRYLESDTQRSSLYSGYPTAAQSGYQYHPNIPGYMYKKPKNVVRKVVTPGSINRKTMTTGTTTSTNTRIDKDNPVVDKSKPSETAKKIQSTPPAPAPPRKKIKINFNELSKMTYEDFRLPRSLADWIWSDNMKFARDKNVFEHNYFNFMWHVCANLPRTLNHSSDHTYIDLVRRYPSHSRMSMFNVTEDTVAIRTVHLAIAFVLGVLMNSRERPNVVKWTELIRKQFSSSRLACDWLMNLIDEEESWLRQMLLKCPIELVKQLFQKICIDLGGSKQHKRVRLVGK